MSRIVLVTGASRGIGAAIATRFAHDNDTVILNYHHSRTVAERLAETLYGRAICADVADPLQVQRMVDEILTEYGRIDVLVNNAAISVNGLFQCISSEDAARLYAVNVGGVLHCTRAVLPAMLSQKAGCVVNLSSMWGEVGASCEVDYSTSKAAVIGFTKAIAKEVGPSGIRVNCISPGVIATDMNNTLSPTDLSALQEETPLGTIGTPQQVAEAAHFLASERASFITGQILGVNGGICI